MNNLQLGKRRWLAGLVVTALFGASSVYADTIRFWTTEEQPERLERQQEMAKDFEKLTGTAVEVIPVTESDLGTRATAAFSAGDLPDVIYHTLQYSLPWQKPAFLTRTPLQKWWKSWALIPSRPAR